MSRFCTCSFSLLLLVAAIVSPATCAPVDLDTVTITVVDTTHDPSEVQFSTGTAMDQLEALKKEELGCLYSNGVNFATFNTCYGENYHVLSQKYIDFFHGYTDKLLQDIKNDLHDVCPQISKPCDNVLKFASDTIMSDPDITEELMSKVDEAKNYQGVDSVLIDQMMEDFKTKYVMYMNIRTATAKSLFETVNSIQKYIKASSLPTDFEYQDYDSGETLRSMGIPNINSGNGGSNLLTTDADQIATQSTFQIGIITGGETAENRMRKLKKQIRSLASPLTRKKKLTDRNFNSNNFLQKLIPEAKDQELLTYYLANGMVDQTQLDLTQLPSTIMNQIRKNKLKLIVNRRLRRNRRMV